MLLAKALSLAPAAAAEFEAAALRPRQPRARVGPEAAAADDPRPTTNLPPPLRSLVGREATITDIVGILGQNRLVTVTGAGGVGKTRAALAAGDAFRPFTEEGVWLVELAPLKHGSFVASAVAKALNVRETTDVQLLDTLLANLKQKSLMLILDNCEHVIADAAVLANALLHGCPYLWILATSREPLQIDGEQTYRLRSLDVPTPAEIAGLSATAAVGYSAVNLFAQRAEAVDSAFALSDQNAPIVAEICRRLDGIPLAIELAAARVKALSVRALATRLDQRFRILTGGDRTTLPRHQTLRALIDWSYDLLDEAEQRLFRRLSIFAGGWTLEAATAVCGDDDEDEFTILDRLTSLADKSLVVVEFSGETQRFRFLECARMRSSG